MLERIKNTLQRIDGFATPIINICVLASIMLALMYFLIPDLRRQVEVSLTNREAWYRIGTIKPKTQKWALYPTEGRGIIRNFYHVDWMRTRQPITQNLIKKAQGSIVVHTADFSVMGRAKEKSGGDNFKSNNPVVSLSLQDDCLYVKEIIFVNSNGEPVVEGSNEENAYVWMKAIKVSCQ